VQIVLGDGIAIDRKKLAVCAMLERDDTAMRSVKHGLDHGDSRHDYFPQTRWLIEMNEVRLHVMTAFRDRFRGRPSRKEEAGRIQFAAFDR